MTDDETLLHDDGLVNETLWRAAFVRRAMMRLMRRMRAERGGEPLSASKLALLGRLNRNGGVTASAIAAAERVRPQSLTRLLAALDADGFIRRSAGLGDRREILIELTDAGRAALIDDIRQRDVWLAAAMATGLTSAEQDVLRLAATLMERLADG